MTYNGAKHASTGQTPNVLFLGREINLPIDLYQTGPVLGPEDGEPVEILAKIQRQTAQWAADAREQQVVAIRRNTAHYLNLARELNPGDLVWVYGETRTDTIPFRKLRIKWGGGLTFS